MSEPGTLARGLALAGALLLAGCGTSSSTDGELGVARFAWAEDDVFACLVGCDAEAPVATGSVATLEVQNAAALPPFTVSSDDPMVVAVSVAADILVEGLRAGSARIRLEEQGSGDLIDTLVIDVADVARVEPDDEFLIAVDGGLDLELWLYDAFDEPLVGVGALAFAASPSLDMGQLEIHVGCDDIDHTECVRLVGREVGMGLLEIEAVTGATDSVPLELVDETAVTDIDLTSQPITNGVRLRRTAYRNGARIYGPACSWSLAPPTTNLFLANAERDQVDVGTTFNLGGTGTVTCEIGTASESIDVTL